MSGVGGGGGGGGMGITRLLDFAAGNQSTSTPSVLEAPKVMVQLDQLQAFTAWRRWD